MRLRFSTLTLLAAAICWLSGTPIGGAESEASKEEIAEVVHLLETKMWDNPEVALKAAEQIAKEWPDVAELQEIYARIAVHKATKIELKSIGMSATERKKRAVSLELLPAEAAIERARKSAPRDIQFIFTHLDILTNRRKYREAIEVCKASKLDTTSDTRAAKHLRQKLENWERFQALQDPLNINLINACMTDDVELFTVLVKRGADPNLLYDDITPYPLFAFAARAGAVKITKWYLDNGHSPDTSYGDSPWDCVLQAAVRENQLEVVKVLVKAGANLNKFPENNTPLYQICLSGTYSHKAMLGFLLESGADPDLGNSAGTTPLMLLSIGYNDLTSAQQVEFAKVLIQHGADPKQKNNRGKDAFDIAVENRSPEMIKFLGK